MDSEVHLQFPVSQETRLKRRDIGLNEEHEMQNPSSPHQHSTDLEDTNAGTMRLRVKTEISGLLRACHKIKQIEPFNYIYEI